MSKMAELIKNGRKRNYPTSIAVKPNTREELRKISFKGVPYDVTINKLLAIVKKNPELMRLLIDYDYNNQLKGKE